MSCCGSGFSRNVVIPDGVLANTFVQRSGGLWVPSPWTLPNGAAVLGEVLAASAANASALVAPPVLTPSKLFQYAFGAQQVNTTTQALFPFFSSAAATINFAAATAATVQFDGVLKELWVNHGTPMGADDIVYTLILNGVPTALTVTLNSGAAGPATDLVTTVAVAAGDAIIVRTTGPTANRAIVPRLQFLLETP